jgi:hypothetical protein
MPRSIVKLACGVLIMLIAIAGVSACATETAEPDYANQITENILLAMNEGDYAQFSEHFDEAMKNSLPEATFQETVSQIREAIGDYVSKTFWKVQTEDGYTAVYYKAKFTLEDEVTVKVVFLETEGKVYVSGLWFE